MSRGLRYCWYYKLTSKGWEEVSSSEVNEPNFMSVIIKSHDVWMLIEQWEQDWLEDGAYSHATEGFDTIWTSSNSKQVSELLKKFGDKRI
jgi:hypothetical protein